MSDINPATDMALRAIISSQRHLRQYNKKGAMFRKYVNAAAFVGALVGVTFTYAGFGTTRAQSNDLQALALELRTIQSDENAARMEAPQFRQGQRVRFRIVIANKSAETVRVSVTNLYYQNRPRLSVGGSEIPYREDISKVVKAMDSKPEFVRIDLVTLQPNEQKELETIDLSAWYERLQPGVYELALSHRFEQGEGWIDLSPIVFEVVRSDDVPADKR